MPRKPVSSEFDTLQVLKDRAFEQFARYGFDGVSVGDIARASGLSKGALYWHYDGKEALYLDCLKQLHYLFDHYVFDPIRTEPDPVLGVLALFKGVERLSHDPRVENGIAGFWLVPSGPTTSALAAAQRAFERASIDAIETTLRRGVATGRFDLGDDLEEFAPAVISIVEAVILPLRHQAPDEVRRTLGVLARTLFRAYAPGIPLPKF